jgi:hypothetical protein
VRSRAHLRVVPDLPEEPVAESPAGWWVCPVPSCGRTLDREGDRCTARWCLGSEGKLGVFRTHPAAEMMIVVS